MNGERSAFLDGQRFLLRIRGKGKIVSISDQDGMEVVGEAVLRIVGEGGPRFGVELERLALAAPSLRSFDGETGTLTLLGESAGGKLEVSAGQGSFDLTAPAKLHYPVLDVRAGKDTRHGCYHLPTFLPAGLRLTGKLTVREGKVTSDLRLLFACAAGEKEALSSLVLELRELAWVPLVPAAGSLADRFRGSKSDLNCDPGLEVNRRRLVLQPVGFRSSAMDPNPSGSTAAAQLATAQAVWGKCCITLEIQPMELITDATLKTSGDPDAIRAAFTDPGANVIEIFFVQNVLACCGGGTAGAIGVASQKIVIAEPNAGNPVLVAHEIGHALGLLHPGFGSNSDAGTVMAPTGSPNVPGTELVTHFTCQNISTPALETLAETCCLSHDKGDHFIRDFPEDVGLEPSDPLPPGRTRYSMSNVWNRRSNTPGTFGANGPEHEDPSRFQLDGVTPFTNFLFARVEQINALLVRDAEVKFFLKHPGSGGGGANLTLLGQAAVPAGLAVGSPRDASIAWQVPAGAPNHSCVFAVVRSPAEPDGDQSLLDWAAFEALSRADNDWAQRNLNFRDTAANASNSNNDVASPPMLVRVPRGGLPQPVRLVLAVDATEAKGLRSLVLEVPGSQHLAIEPGARTEVVTEKPLVPGQDFVLVARAVLPPGAAPGTTFTVHVDPRVGRDTLAGYSFSFRVASPSHFLAELNDTLAAALADLTAVLDSSAACRLLRELRSHLARGPWSVDETAEATARFEPDLRTLVKELSRSDEGEALALPESFERWLRALGETPITSLEALLDLAQRFQIAAFWRFGN